MAWVILLVKRKNRYLYGPIHILFIWINPYGINIHTICLFRSYVVTNNRKEGVLMSIFHLQPIANEALDDGKNIQLLDINVQNIGTREFDVLIQGYTGENLIHLFLYNLKIAPDPVSSVTLKDLHADFNPLSLQFITNINDPSVISVTIITKDKDGHVLNTYTEENLFLEI
jgi:hypothetical protein